MVYKFYVTVKLTHTKEGHKIPTNILWEHEDGEIEDFHVTVRDAQNKASTKGGGIGMRYEIAVMGKERMHITYLFYDEIDDLWFVENKHAPDMGKPPY